MRNKELLDRDSACLLWDFIMLLCRQNGVGLQQRRLYHIIWLMTTFTCTPSMKAE